MKRAAKSKLPPRYSIKTRVTLLTLAIFIVSLWSLSFYVSRILHDDLHKILGEQQFATVSMVAGDVNNDIQNRLNALEVFAKTLAAAVPDGAPATQNELETHPLYQTLFNAGIYVTGLDGTAIASVPVSVGRVGVNYMDRDHVVAALRQGRSTVGKPVLGKLLNVPVVSMAAPIRDPQGKVIGAIVGVIDLSQPNFLDKVTQGAFNKNGTVSILSSQHRLTVTSSDKKLILFALPAPGVNPYLDRNMAGFEGYTIVVNVLGQEQLASVKKIPAAQWYLFSGQSTEDVFAPVRALQQRMLLAAIFLGLLAVALVWWMLRRQLVPVFDAARRLSELAQSDAIPPPLPIIRQDEIGELIGAFNRLLGTLGRRDAALKDSQQDLATTLDSIGDAVIATDTAGRITRMNPTAMRLTAWSLTDALGQPLAEVFRIVNAETRLPAVNPVQMVTTRGEVVSLDNHTVLLSRDGREYQIADTAAPIRNASDQIVGVVLVFSDVTERKQAEAKLQLAASVFTHADEGITITDTQGTIVDVNAAFSRITGYSREQAIGQNSRILKSGRQDSAFYKAMWRDLAEQGHWSGEIWNRRQDGEVYAELLTISALRDTAGNLRQYVGLFSDITAIKAHQNQLEHIAHFDALTNLPNRVLLADRLQQAMAQAQRRSQQLAVVFLDLDGFKAINDHHGHEIGDQMLVSLAHRMKEVLREGDTLARMGGDEFVAVLIDLEETSASVPLLDRLLVAAALPVQVGDLNLRVSASLGITFYPQAQDLDADQLLRQADQAMYQAKVAGKNRYYLFDAAQDSSIREHHGSLDRIRLALASHEFILYYQPKVNMRSGRVIGAEALIRWQHPQRGLLAPATFLPAIEDHPLAVDVGEWVIDTALHQMEVWHAAGLDLPVSVNIGARQLQQADFVARLRSILAKHPQVDPGCIELEVLETSALADMAQVSQVIEDCDQMGVKFALDDFGTGYSSLTYLKRLRVGMLKIDQSFVRDMLDDPDDLAILQGVIGLAAAFNREVIAEGVETVAHGTALLQLGCELAQGYGIARPMPAEQVPEWAASWQPDAAWRDMPKSDPASRHIAN